MYVMAVAHYQPAQQGNLLGKVNVDADNCCAVCSCRRQGYACCCNGLLPAHSCELFWTSLPVLEAPHVYGTITDSWIADALCCVPLMPVQAGLAPQDQEVSGGRQAGRQTHTHTHTVEQAANQATD
jgi:hypothetical protein